MLDVSVFGEMSSPATGLGTARTNQVNSVFNNWRFEDVARQVEVCPGAIGAASADKAIQQIIDLLAA
jgi:hypothetical protein